MVDWTRLLAESFRQFMRDEGLEQASLREKLSPDLLRRFLEKFAGTADPEILKRQLADAPGAVGFLISLMLALPAEGRIASVLMLSEAMKTAGLPVPHSVRAVAVLAFEAAGEAGVTDEDIRRYRSRVLVALSGVTPGMALAAGTILAGAAAVVALHSRSSEPKLESTLLTPEDSPMSTSTDSADTTPTVPPAEARTVSDSTESEAVSLKVAEENRLRFMEFLSAAKQLRGDDVITQPRRPSEYWRGFVWVQEHLHAKNEGLRKQAREAFNLLPADLTETEYETLKQSLDVLFRVRGPRSDRPSAGDRRKHTALIHRRLNRASAWEAEVRQIGRDRAWFWQRRVTIPLADMLDDLVNDDVRGTFTMLVHFAVILFAGLVGFGSFALWGFLGVFSLFLMGVSGGLIGASAIALIGRAIAHSEVIDQLYAGKNLDGTDRDLTHTEVGGSLLMIGSLVAGVLQLVAWLAPGFGFLSESPWWFSPFVLNVALFGVWGAAFAVLARDPWENEVKPVFFHRDEHGKMVPWVSGDAHASHPPAAAHGKHDDKSHGKAHGHADHAPPAPSIYQLAQEKQDKQLLTVPGVRRAAVLKISTGATLVGLTLNIWWPFSGQNVDLSVGLFVAAFFLLLTLLTVSQYMGAMILIEMMQRYTSTLLRQGLVLTLVLFALSFAAALFLSQQGRIGFVKAIHAKTDAWLEVPSLPVDGEGSGAPIRQSVTITETYASVTSAASQPLSCPDRDQLEAQSVGFCTRNPYHPGCDCQ